MHVRVLTQPPARRRPLTHTWSPQDGDGESPELSDWERFAAEEYDILVAEEAAGEPWDDGSVWSRAGWGGDTGSRPFPGPAVSPWALLPPAPRHVPSGPCRVPGTAIPAADSGPGWVDGL